MKTKQWMNWLPLIGAMVLGGLLVSCEETGEQFVVREAGVWDVTSQTTKVYRDGNLISDSTFTADLGQMEFRMTGQGFRHLPTQVDTFVWQLNKEDDRLIVYYKIGPFMNAAISGRTENEMTLDWEYSRTEDTTEITTAHTAVVVRQ